MGLFTDYIYEKLPFDDLSLQDVEKVALHHFPEHKVYTEGNKLFIKCNKLMDSRRHEFRANGEITINRGRLCFKTKVNKTTLLLHFFLLLVLVGLMAYRYYDIYEMKQLYIMSIYHSGFMANYGFKLLGMGVVYLVVFAIGLVFQLHRETEFLVRTIVAALEIYKMK